MHILRVFPKKTAWTPADDFTDYGFPPIFLYDADLISEVHISVCFTWDIPIAARMRDSWNEHYKTVKIGGPAFGDPGGEFTPCLYTKKGVTITSRGCGRKCKFCYVPRREGNIRLLKIKPGNIIQDNNLLACPTHHIEKVFEMLKTQKHIEFCGGLDLRLLKPWHIEAFRNLAINKMWFAYDYISHKILRQGAERLSGFSQDQKRIYVLVGWKDDTVKKAEKRLEQTFEVGFLPFLQFYRGPGENFKSKEWLKLIHTWSRPKNIRIKHRKKRSDNQKLLFKGR